MQHIRSLREILIDFQVERENLFLLRSAGLEALLDQEYSLEKSRMSA